MSIKHDIKDFVSGIFLSMMVFPIALLFAFKDSKCNKRLKNFFNKGGNVMENDNK